VPPTAQPTKAIRPSKVGALSSSAPPVAFTCSRGCSAIRQFAAPSSRVCPELRPQADCRAPSSAGSPCCSSLAPLPRVRADSGSLVRGSAGGAPGEVPSRAGSMVVSLPASCSPCLPPRLLLSRHGPARRHAGPARLARWPSYLPPPCQRTLVSSLQGRRAKISQGLNFN